MDQYVNDGAEAADDSDGFAVAGANGSTDASADRQSDEPETANGIATHQTSTLYLPENQENHIVPATMTNQ